MNAQVPLPGSLSVQQKTSTRSPLRIEYEESPVVVHVSILLRREVNTRADSHAALVRFIDFLATFNLEGEVLDPDLVVAVLALVSGAKS